MNSQDEDEIQQIVDIMVNTVANTTNKESHVYRVTISAHWEHKPYKTLSYTVDTDDETKLFRIAQDVIAYCEHKRDRTDWLRGCQEGSRAFVSISFQRQDVEGIRVVTMGRTQTPIGGGALYDARDRMMRHCKSMRKNI